MYRENSLFLIRFTRWNVLLIFSMCRVFLVTKCSFILIKKWSVVNYKFTLTLLNTFKIFPQFAKKNNAYKLDMAKKHNNNLIIQQFSEFKVLRFYLLFTIKLICKMTITEHSFHRFGSIYQFLNWKNFENVNWLLTQWFSFVNYRPRVFYQFKK